MARDLAVLVGLIDVPALDLVGYSMGAIVSLLFATKDERVRRLVVGGVGAGVIECGGVDRRAISNDAIIDALQVDDPTTISTPGAAAFRSLADAIDADRSALVAQIALENISASTLVLAGDADPLAVRPEVLSEAIPGARLQLLSGDHVGAIGDPRFTQSIVDFLA
jgi:pimeloyl-ACP methyl ester carboxylesterase